MGLWDAVRVCRFRAFLSRDMCLQSMDLLTSGRYSLFSRSLRLLEASDGWCTRGRIDTMSQWPDIMSEPGENRFQTFTLLLPRTFLLLIARDQAGD